MEIRKAHDEDIPEIIALLKVSLGESLMPKTEKFWKWKHVANPFGPSMVLVATENNKIIGLRAFMNWEWLYNNKSYKAVRAVDTATHPDHQGKGIFKKLTLAGIEELKTIGTDFIYNTPNEKSKPGYLKMGWEEQGRMSLKIKLNCFCFKGSMPIKSINWTILALNDDFYKGANIGIQTKYDQQFLMWRYAHNPIFDYHFITDQSSYFLVYRYKQHKFGVEMRIVDFLVSHTHFDKVKKKELSKQLRVLTGEVFLTSISGNHYQLLLNHYPKMGMIPVLNKGPMVTLRNIALAGSDFEQLLLPTTWAYSLGDLELF